MYKYICIRTHVDLHTHIHTPIRINMHTYAYIRITHARKLARAHKYTCTHTYIRTHHAYLGS